MPARTTRPQVLTAALVAVLALLLAACPEEPVAEDPDATEAEAVDEEPEPKPTPEPEPDPMVAEELAAEATTHIEVLGTDELRFEPDFFVVPAGEEVTVELTAGPGVAHNFGITETGDAVVPDHVPGTRPFPGVDPGETDTGTFTIDQPGTYTVYCYFDGHGNQGMVAELVVVEVDG